MDSTSEKLFTEISEKCDIATWKHYLFQSGIKALEKQAIEWRDEKTDSIKGVTYQKLLLDITSLGTCLYVKGYKGKTIAIIGNKSYNLVLLFLTCMCSDIRVVMLDEKEKEEDINRKLLFADTSACFMDKPLNSSVFELAKLDLFLNEGSKLFAAGDTRWIDDNISAKQPCMMMFTSGTGGKQKLSVLKQESFTLERIVWQGLGLDDGKTECLITLPLFHIAGIGDLRGALMLGESVYLSSGLKYLLDEYAYVKPKISFMVPAQAMLLYTMLMGKDKETVLKMLGGNFQAIRTSGAPLPQTIRDFFKSYDIEVTSDYGMTETTGPVSVACLKDGKVFTKPGSVGRILNCLHVYADSPDEKGCGEIVIEGPCVFDGYYKDQKESEAILKDGKLFTGDIGYVDEDGFLFIVGRKKNIIILSNGENIIPEELENKVYQIPQVKECLVYAENDKLAVKIYSDKCKDKKYFTEKIKDINKNCPNYKVIRTIHLEEDPLPKTKTGKILRGVRGE